MILNKYLYWLAINAKTAQQTPLLTIWTLNASVTQATQNPDHLAFQTAQQMLLQTAKANASVQEVKYSTQVNA